MKPKVTAKKLEKIFAAKRTKRSAGSQQRLVGTPRRYTPRDHLANALAKISNDIVAVGLGQILLGRLASHMLKLRRPNVPDQRPGESPKTL